VIIVFMVVIFLAQLIYNLSQGYVLVPPPKVAEPLVWQTFHSQIKPISVNHPQDWLADDLFQGNHGDTEVIAYIDPISFNYPYLTIAFREMVNASLEEVASWGESRITHTPHTTTSLEKIDISGQSALLRKYSYRDWLENRINCSHVYLLNHNNAYTVELCVDEDQDSAQMQAVFDQIIQSISVN
jgi:hypothetical protein